MCRNIRTLHHLDPACTPDEIRDAARQFVRKVTGFTKPSRANEAAFETAIDEMAATTERLFRALVTTTPPRDRAALERRARERSERRFASRTDEG